MKKLSALLLALALALPGFAREGEVFSDAPAPADYRFTNRIGVSYLPTVPSVAFIFVAIVQGLALEDDEQIQYTMPPVFSLEGLYSFNSRISAGLYMDYFSSSYTITKKETGEFVSKGTYINTLSVMPEFRFNYLDREKVKLYGIVAAGAMLAGGNSSDFQANVCFQLNPVGVEFGGTHFFGFTEIGAGISWFGLRAGLGYRF